MLFVSDQGYVEDKRIELKIFSGLEHGRMDKVNGIVVHQTGAPAAANTFHSYARAGANGAHFLIDLDGKIWQTASLKRVTYHVGRLHSRCIAERKCSPAELRTSLNLDRKSSLALHRHEAAKKWPERYPSNVDSIGIELVGFYSGPKDVYDDVTAAQNSSLSWLVKQLEETLNVSSSSVFRHSEVGRKNPSEAATAKW